MHTINADAHGMAALAILEGLALKLMAKGLLEKAEVLEICEALKKTYDAQGMRHDSGTETDAGLLVGTFISAINSRY